MDEWTPLTLIHFSAQRKHFVSDVMGGLSDKNGITVSPWRAALEAALVQVGPGMFGPWDKSKTTQGIMLGADGLAVLEAAVVQVGPRMMPLDLSKMLFVFATLGLKPRAEVGSG